MKKLKNMLLATIAIVALTTNAFAGSFGVGVSGSLFNISGEGTETEGTAAEVNNKATASNNGFLGEVFAEYSFDNGFTLGASYIPGSADVNSSKLSRTDIQTSVTGTAGTVATSLQRTAQAEIDKHITYYVEYPLGGSGLYAKGGMVTLDVNTTENLGTPKYGNDSVSGAMYGLGFKADTGESMFYKLEATHTAMDSINITSTGNSTGSPVNKISADLDVTKATFALGFRF